MNERRIPGIRFLPTRFRPESSNFKGRWIDGVRFEITDRDTFDSTRLGLEIAYALMQLWPGKIDAEVDRWLVGNREVLQDLKDGKNPRVIVQTMSGPLSSFLESRRAWLLYPE